MAEGIAGAQRISMQQWNRTLLQRQHLLARADEDAIEVVDRSVGLQAQDPQAPHYALAARIVDYDPAEVDELLAGREVVRMASLRGTVFLMDAEDSRWIRPAVQPVLDRSVRSNHVRKLVTAQPEEIVEHARQLLSGAELSVKELGAALSERWPDESREGLVAVARCGLLLVQTPPRGLWGRSGGVQYALLDDWAGSVEPAITGTEAVQELIRLYLRGFGPASAAGVQTWCGLTGLRPTLDAMVDDWELQTYESPDGVTLYDLEGLSLADGDEPAPPRLLAPFDNLVVAQADRDRVMDDEVYRALQTPNGLSPGFLLVDGRVVGSWKPQRDKGSLTVETDYLLPSSVANKKAVDGEIERLVGLLSAG
ncbi:winged helix DNA-binding domain-containing protein [Jongsikchunia kroppenstedtii]|uniref:winged helix DNA-binding domain-containing protein n=1 Tax=Jongsikchunia kroppenstedtii TaxID=1121721 RepID=UPI0003A8965F|nr:winged helix DNA-binding domain-containing protein [Jongsikchunia kroppenstedtii]